MNEVEDRRVNGQCGCVVLAAGVLGVAVVLALVWVLTR